MGIVAGSGFDTMLRFIRKHQLLGGALLFLVIVSFVVFMAPTGSNAGGPKFDIGSYDGKRVSREEFIQALNETRLSYFLLRGDWPTDNDSQTQQAVRRLISVRNQEKYDILVPDDAVSRRIQRLFADPDTGAFRRSLYDNVLQRIASTAGISKDAFYDAIRHDIGEEQLQRMLTVAGSVVAPQEARGSILDDLKMAKTEVVVFDGASMEDQLAPTPEAYRQYYTNNLARYRSQETVVASYVEFLFDGYKAEASTLLATNKNTDILIEQRYAAAGADSFTSDDGETLSEIAAKESIREELVTEESRRVALRTANRFIESLLLSEKPKGLATFRELALEAGLEVGETEALSNYVAPTTIEAPREFTQAVFGLTAESPYTSAAIEGTGAFFVATLSTRNPSRVQEYSEVEPRVESDWKRDELRELARKAGEAFYATATNELASGKSFSDIASAAGLGVIRPELFNQRTQSFSNAIPNVNLFRLKSAIRDLEPGTVAPYQSSGSSDGLITYLASLEDPDEAAIEENLEGATDNLRYARANAFYSEWLESELASSSLRVTQEEEE